MKAGTGQAPIIAHAADALRLARKLPVRPARNDLRQLARGLLALHKSGMRANVHIFEPVTSTEFLLFAAGTVRIVDAMG